MHALRPACLPVLVQMRSSALIVEERHLPIGDAMWIARSR
jgi:hypothetical protein